MYDMMGFTKNHTLHIFYIVITYLSITLTFLDRSFIVMTADSNMVFDPGFMPLIIAVSTAIPKMFMKAQKNEFVMICIASSIFIIKTAQRSG
jgi:ABC-type multidrug transport system permease subunit